MTILTGTFSEDLSKFVLVSRGILLRMRNIADELLWSKPKHNISCSIGGKGGGRGTGMRNTTIFVGSFGGENSIVETCYETRK